MTPKAGRAIAWLSFALGIAVSVAGNIMHSAITPAGPGELVGAAFWPLALMLSIEVLTRVHWQRGRWWMSARVVGLFLVGIVAAVLSYRHLAGLMTSWGEDAFNAHLGPLAVDGLMLLAATALLSISREARPDETAEPAVSTTSRVVVLSRDWGPLAPPRTAEEWFTAVDNSPDVQKAKAAIRADVLSRIAAQDEKPIGINAVVTEKPDGSIAVTSEKPAPPKEPSRLHIVDSISDDAAVEAARQAFFQSLDQTGKPLSAAKVAAMLNQPKSTVHRNYTSKWASEGRRIER